MHICLKMELTQSIWNKITLLKIYIIREFKNWKLRKEKHSGFRVESENRSLHSYATRRDKYLQAMVSSTPKLKAIEFVSKLISLFLPYICKGMFSLEILNYFLLFYSTHCQLNDLHHFNILALFTLFQTSSFASWLVKILKSGQGE